MANSIICDSDSKRQLLICKQCGKSFYGKPGKGRNRWLYCSPECKQFVDSKRQRSHFGICIECGKEFKGYKNQRYCSRQCQHKERTRLSEQNRKRICQWCGKEFIMLIPSGKANRGEVNEGLFCSRKCWGLYRKSLPRKNYPSCKVWFVTCQQCGKLFTAKQATAKCCSDKCRKEHLCKYNFFVNSLNKNIKEKKCKQCGRLFTPEYGDKRKIFCSKICSINYSRKLRGSGCHRKRAKYYGVEYEYVNVFKVFRRDGWHCQICGKPTPKKNRGTRYSNAPELDHRIPMSKGGGHLYSNVQCACHACNSWKSNNNEFGQMPLFGIK